MQPPGLTWAFQICRKVYFQREVWHSGWGCAPSWNAKPWLQVGGGWLCGWVVVLHMCHPDNLLELKLG
jgi:hypothetical protein